MEVEDEDLKGNRTKVRVPLTPFVVAGSLVESIPQGVIFFGLVVLVFGFMIYMRRRT